MKITDKKKTRLWKVVDGAIRDAVHSHPDIGISARRRDSITKRIVGAVLALERGQGRLAPAEQGTAALTAATPTAAVEVGSTATLEAAAVTRAAASLFGGRKK